MVGFPFFDAATGSSGQGLSVAAGVAEAARLDGIDKRVYCIVGDGEAREGQIAEAFDHIAERGLTNVLPIFNCNEFGQADRVSHQQSAETLAKKLEAYGFDVRTIDGHKPEADQDRVRRVRRAQHGQRRKPMAVVAKTVKGWGAASIQGGGWHGKPPSGRGAAARARRARPDRRIELTTTL
jgi:transketolase